MYVYIYIYIYLYIYIYIFELLGYNSLFGIPCWGGRAPRGKGGNNARDKRSLYNVREGNSLCIMGGERGVGE